MASAITGSDAMVSAGLPLDEAGQRFGTYADAIGALDRPGQVTDLEQLPLRAAVGDPCDLLHWWDPAKVAHAAGQYQVMPVGVFQPADDDAGSVHHDLNLWHSMVREFSEELLGGSEDYRRFGSQIHYDQWDFYRLTQGRQRGDLRVSVLDHSRKE